MRTTGVLLVLAAMGCAERAQECDVTFDPVPRLTAPVGSPIDFVVRIRNGSEHEVHVADLAVSPSEFELRTERATFTVPPGSCAQPVDMGALFRFSPRTFGEVDGELSATLDGRPVRLALSGFGTGPRLDAAETLNFGTLGLARATERTLALRNVGTIGTTAHAELVSVSPLNAETRADELCVGTLSAGGCVRAEPISLKRDGAFPVTLVARTSGEKAWDVTLRAADQLLTTRVVALAVDTSGCSLEIEPRRIEFGLRVAPDVGRQRVTLRNLGASPCVVSSIATTDRQFTVVGAPPRAQVLPARAELGFEVNASLRAPPGATAELRVDELTVPLRAMPPSGCFMVTPAAIDFGTALSDCSTPAQRLTLTNVCSSPVYFGSARTFDPFYVTLTSTPRVVPPADAVTVELRMQKGSAGFFSGGVVLDLGNDESLVVGLSGRVAPPSPRTDFFRADRRGLIDFLFVLDDSPSFARQHARVRTELGRFATAAADYRSSFNMRVGVTTTDVSATGPQGRLRSTDGGVRWANADLPTFGATFGELSELSTSGAEHQSCLEAAARAVTGRLASDPLANGGFRRPESNLAILCVTDDVEHTPDPARWRSALRSVDGGPTLTYSVIGPIDSACAVDALDDAGSHAATVTGFSGILGDVCRPWSLFGVSTPLHTARTHYFLTDIPRAGSLQVFVGGTELTEFAPSGVRNWEYQASSNAVVLRAALFGLDPPDITVTYRSAACW